MQEDDHQNHTFELQVRVMVTVDENLPNCHGRFKHKFLGCALMPSSCQRGKSCPHKNVGKQTVDDNGRDHAGNFTWYVKINHSLGLEAHFTEWPST